ncbi:hypothetical protein F511_07997 [Dorcoceras hygrometricum]|uniref:Uncharacterized protein n=1 Tax=Dorcoceras hygrometricum TaxID=472368 RepID=A0A2Z7CLM9_9LAMI|nr:hypothetical protein F511_07997 [Dorcoceras hygrometricum]
MSPSVSSVAGVSTSSFGLVGTTTFGLAKKTQLWWICVARTLIVVIVAQRLEDAVEVERVTPVPHLPAGICYHGFSAGRGVDPAGGVPGGGLSVPIIV